MSAESPSDGDECLPECLPECPNAFHQLMEAALTEYEARLQAHCLDPDKIELDGPFQTVAHDGGFLNVIGLGTLYEAQLDELQAYLSLMYEYWTERQQGHSDSEKFSCFYSACLAQLDLRKIQLLQMKRALGTIPFFSGM